MSSLILISYVNLDDVSVYEQDLPAFAGLDTTISGQDSTWNFVEMQKLENVKIYPNPSSGTFSLETGISDISIELFDLRGKSVYLQEFQNESGVITFKLELPAAMYLIKITNLQTGEKSVSKLVIQK